MSTKRSATDLILAGVRVLLSLELRRMAQRNTPQDTIAVQALRALLVAIEEHHAEQLAECPQEAPAGGQETDRAD